MVRSASASRSDTRASASDSVSRRSGASVGQASLREGSSQIDAALRHRAGRTALTERLAASGVLRELSLQVDGPVAHPAELGQQVWGEPGPERPVLADADASGVLAPSLPAGLPQASGAPSRSLLDEGTLAALDRVFAPGQEGASWRRLPRLGPRVVGAAVAGATVGLGISSTGNDPFRALGPDLRLNMSPDTRDAWVERRVDGWLGDRWEPVDVPVERTPDEGVRIDRRALEAAVGPLPRELDAALAGAAERRAQPEDGGWVEGHPALTGEDRALGELPGFAPGEVPETQEGLVPPELDLLTHTGHGGSLDGLGLDEPLITRPAPEALRGPTVLERYDGEIPVPSGAADAPGFADRAAELAVEGRQVRPLEGRAGARLEAATGARLVRPDPADASHDFVDRRTGERIEIKGPLPAVNGMVPDDRVTGLIASTLREASQQTGADVIVVDVEGLSEAQVERVREALIEGARTELPVRIMR